MDVDTRRLRVFLCVADTLHFGRAAQRLHIAQPSVSQQIAQLERQLGHRLFVRGASGVTLTSAGRELARHVGPAIDDLDAAIDRFTAAHGRPTLRIGAISSLASYLVPQAAATAPDEVKIEVAEGPLPSLLQRLIAREVDVVFCYDAADREPFHALKSVVLGVHPVQFALPAESEHAALPTIPWAVAAEQPWIMPSATRQYWADMLERFARRGPTPRVVAEATTFSGQEALVAAGIGWTFTSPWVLHQAGVVVRPPVDPDTLTLLAITNPGEDRAEIAALTRAVADKASTMTAQPERQRTLLNAPW